MHVSPLPPSLLLAGRPEQLDIANLFEKENNELPLARSHTHAS